MDISLPLASTAWDESWHWSSAHLGKDVEFSLPTPRPSDTSQLNISTPLPRDSFVRTGGLRIVENGFTPRHMYRLATLLGHIQSTPDQTTSDPADQLMQLVLGAKNGARAAGENTVPQTTDERLSAAREVAEAHRARDLQNHIVGHMSTPEPLRQRSSNVQRRVSSPFEARQPAPGQMASYPMTSLFEADSFRNSGRRPAENVTPAVSGVNFPERRQYLGVARPSFSSRVSRRRSTGVGAVGRGPRAGRPQRPPRPATGQQLAISSFVPLANSISDVPR